MTVWIALVFLLVLWTFGPALMCVDPRDAFPDAGDNIIVFLAIASLCFGAGCCIAFLALPLLLRVISGMHLPPFPGSMSESTRLVLLFCLPLRLLQPMRI